MAMITNALQRASKRKPKGESKEYSFKVFTEPPPVGSYSFDGFFYYVPGQFHESSAKKKKNDEGKPVDQGIREEGSKKQEARTQTKGEKGPTIKKTSLKPHGVGKSIRRLQEVREEEEKQEKEERIADEIMQDATEQEVQKDVEEGEANKEIFVPNWGIKRDENISDLVDCEDYLVHSVPKGVEASFMKMKRLDFENAWIQKKTEAWFHDREMLRRYRSALEKIEKELMIKKSLKDEINERKNAEQEMKKKVEELEKENILLKKDLESEKGKRKEWEEGFTKEHACRRQWEDAAKLLQEKYEDKEGNINNEIYNFCVGSFLESQEFKNLYMRLNYAAIKDSILEAREYVQEKMPEYEKTYGAYLNAEDARSYVLPWQEGFSAERYFGTFPTPENSDEDEDDDDDAERSLEEACTNATTEDATQENDQREETMPDQHEETMPKATATEESCK